MFGGTFRDLFLAIRHDCGKAAQNCYLQPMNHTKLCPVAEILMGTLSCLSRSYEYFNLFIEATCIARKKVSIVLFTSIMITMFHLIAIHKNGCCYKLFVRVHQRSMRHYHCVIYYESECVFYSIVNCQSEFEENYCAFIYRAAVNAMIS